MKYIQNTIINLLLFFYITASYLSAMHTDHQALEEHGDCKVCIVIKNLNSSTDLTLEIDNYNYICKNKE